MDDIVLEKAQAFVAYTASIPEPPLSVPTDVEVFELMQSLIGALALANELAQAVVDTAREG